LSHTLASTRTLVLSMDGGEAMEALRSVAPYATGALGLKFFSWVARRYKKVQKESGDFQIRLVDEGAEMREERAAEVKVLRAEACANLERAHRSEIKEVALRIENNNLRSKLSRQDEQKKALIAQLTQLGAVPIVLSPEWDSGAYEVDMEDTLGGVARRGPGQGIDPTRRG
jgi:hypothetical protein